MAVFTEVSRVLRSGGQFIVTFSNRWFDTKAVAIWAELHEFERMGLVLEYFQRSGEFDHLQTYSIETSAMSARFIRGLATVRSRCSTRALIKRTASGKISGGKHVFSGYAMVTGPSRTYLWILSRSKVLDEEIFKDLISKAEKWGFDTKKLIRVEHDE
jgi:hypothetical protein